MNKQKRGFDYIRDGIIKKVIEFCYDDRGETFREQAKVSQCDFTQYKSHPILDFYKHSAIICRCIIGNKHITYDEGMANYLFDVVQCKKMSSYDKLIWQITNTYVNYRLHFLLWLESQMMIYYVGHKNILII